MEYIGGSSLHSWSKAELTVDVITAVAEATGNDPVEMTPPLVDVIDPEALSLILGDATGFVQVTFEYQDRAVEISSDGEIAVRDPADG